MNGQSFYWVSLLVSPLGTAVMAFAVIDAFRRGTVSFDERGQRRTVSLKGEPVAFLGRVLGFAVMAALGAAVFLFALFKGPTAFGVKG